ncbi:MAG: phosphoesterase [Desulfurococcaceae archaeon]
MSKQQNLPRIFIGSDWDLDGIMAAALVLYAQDKLNLYPHNGKAIVEKKPLDPDRFKYIFQDLNERYEYMVLLDIPYTDRVYSIIKLVKRHFGIRKIIYFDHHLSTIMHKKDLVNVVDEIIVDHGKPTSILVAEVLEKRGVQIPDRIKRFLEVIEFMDVGKKIPEDKYKIFEYLKQIAKAIAYTRDETLWARTVEWFASPIADLSIFDTKPFKLVMERIVKMDKEISDIALNLALTGVKIGDFRFIDARSKQNAAYSFTPLVSRLASILKKPVIVRFKTSKDFNILVIKASKGRAYRLAKNLYTEGVAQDIGGHANLAIVKIPKNIENSVLIDVLRKIMYYL